MNSGSVPSASSTAVQGGKDRAGRPGQQQPVGITMPWNRPKIIGDGESLPEWKIHCLCSEQSLLSPRGVHIAGGWF
ncbi:hypothetical protein HPP92_008483 [Vanilla planifolia]|uniref:Uncharacterized protein n=1 Tax=Vanilla planifolia TaxID=51239 RepID=A0A835RDQ3_VANPL|nr:hypothetical protein HPP92_008642 [Vanilla planifolia]KAG0486388.1 hypothetical protein HPP92_008483 [Vanilla planifolia]